jgi:hypothetical protein
MAPQTPKRLRSIQDLQNTFIGNLRIPELGLSEAGGLFFR